MVFDDVLSKRDDMNRFLRTKLDETTERWGVKVTNVEVREVNPPQGVQEAMTRQMSAERTRRAAVTEAEGQKQAAITVAEGSKQSAILAAEGERQAVILAAEGERQAAVLRAEGLAGGLKKVLAVSGDLDETTLRLQYLETLKLVGTSKATKIVLPMEVGGVLRGVSELLGGLPSGGPDARPDPAAVEPPTST
jgi:regulator of protease activity HflC (stomatin/prohibitin superfamily)